MKLLPVIAIAFLALTCFVLTQSQSEKHVISTYATPLQGRVRNQIANANLALQKLDGCEIAPGETFSFNKTVGTWSRDAGYRKAPVSFNGQLIWTWGGGVCQTSTTLYNAALLAGLEIVERHRHRFAPGYITPGRDAAVAYSNIDLRFKNPYSKPVTLRCRISDNKLVCAIEGDVSATRPFIVSRFLDARPGKQMQESTAGKASTVMNPGKWGYSVATYRVFRGANSERRELLSIDNYPAMNRVVSRGGG